jgi:Flagellar transcriptional activator (FlhC)
LDFWDFFPKLGVQDLADTGCAMRISDDRYSHERLRLDLALRLLRHEARTQTIRTWTGLTDDRIRNLYRSYMSRGARYVPRHRGKSPHQVSFFMRSLRIQWEAAQLASLLSLFSVIPATSGTEVASSLPGIVRGERLCYAFEAYRTVIPNAQISFEHAVFLAVALARGDQLRVGGCSQCGAMLVLERFPVRDKRCYRCANPVHLR